MAGGSTRRRRSRSPERRSSTRGTTKDRDRRRSSSPSSHRRIQKDFVGQNFRDKQLINAEAIPEPQACEEVVEKDDNGEAEWLRMKQEMEKIFGFSSFKSTKYKKVPGNQILSVKINKKSVFRQYMNRKGGFNRPLDPSK